MLEIKECENLSKHTTFHLGGPAKYFAIVRTADELREALEFSAKNDLKYFILGGGSNVLFSDAGFDGLVIKISFMEIAFEGEELVAGAGVPLFLAIKKSAEAGLAGLENLAGIPGTVGGAAVNNAGAYGKSISGVVEKAEILMPATRSSESGARPAKLQRSGVDKSWFEYEYRGSKLKYWEKTGLKPIILKVWFRLVKGDKEAIEQKIQEVISNRVAKEPKGFSAGCAFKNIKGEAVREFLEKNNFSPDEKNLFASRGAIPAAWFIEHAELKGKKIGGAYVASEHANYIMNDGTAKAEDVLMLLSYIKQQVRDKYGVQLEEEVEIII